MTKIVIAPDKLKGSLSSWEFCKTVGRILAEQLPDAEIISLPLADGGDGTVAILRYYLDAEKVVAEVHDPLFRKINAHYLYNKTKAIAYIEMATASGLNLLKKNEYNPLYTSSFGTGELIKHALGKGAKHIVLGIGGSATNDAGLGMARALGYTFLSKKGKPLQGTGQDLLQLHSIEHSHVCPQLSNAQFTVACDVKNPLFGKHGAAFVYAPQKGANHKTVRELDTGLQQFNEIALRTFHRDISQISGAGAAGGLGAGTLLFLNAQLQLGITVVKQFANFRHHIQGAEWIISGEGALDSQTLNGKVVQGVLDECAMQKVALFCGQIHLHKDELQRLPIGYSDAIENYATSHADAMQNASFYLEKITRTFTKLLKSKHFN